MKLVIFLSITTLLTAGCTDHKKSEHAKPPPPTSQGCPSGMVDRNDGAGCSPSKII
jgi:hypothetical protein